MPKDPNQLGALWNKESSKGQYMSGHITINEETINIVCFKNGYKKEDKHPDWIILKSKPKDNQMSSKAKRKKQHRKDIREERRKEKIKK